MNVIIAGSRTFFDYPFLKMKCDKIIHDRKCTIFSGTANGADKLGEKYAKEKGFPVKKFPADWNKYGKAAGYSRNLQMAVNAEYLIAFWDGQSKGTKNMIEIAQQANLVVRVIKY